MNNTPPPKTPPPVLRVLFLAASPTNEARLRLNAESARIKEAIASSTQRDLFVFLEEHSVRRSSLQHYILKHKPHVVHFSGHGSANGSLILEDDEGRAAEASSEAVSALFRIVAPTTRFVVLNSCHSLPQASAIAPFVEAVIGMSASVRDDTAIGFARALYESLGETVGADWDIAKAFSLAQNWVLLNALPGSELPTLLGSSSNPR